MRSLISTWVLAEVRALFAAQQAVSWLWEVLRGLRGIEAQYAIVGGRTGEIDWYIRAKFHAVNELHHRLSADAREGPRAMLRTLSEFEPSRWIEEDYGTETFEMVRRKVDRLRGAMLSMLTAGVALPEPSAVA